MAANHMRVGLDARLARYPGVGRYIRNALRGLSVQPFLELVVYAPDDSTARHLCQENRNLTVQLVSARSPGIHEQWAMPRQMARDHLDVFHAPHYVVPVVTACPLIVTLHDLVLFHYPDKLNPFMRLYYAWMVRQAIHRSRIILCDSDFIAAEVCQHFRVPERKFQVVPISVAEHFVPPEPEVIRRFKRAHNLGRYILFVGTWKPWKNVGRLLDAFEMVIRSGYEGDLVLAGKAARYQFDYAERVRRMMPRVRVFGEVDEADLPALYGAADLLAMPSTYEGFGLPVLEAMACGTPVVVARAGPLPEVAGEAGVYCDPLDVDSIAHAMQSIVEAPERRAVLAELGRERARLFSSERMGQSLVEAYRSACEVSTVQ